MKTDFFNLIPGIWYDSDVEFNQLKFKRKIKWTIPTLTVPTALDGGEYCSNKDTIRLRTTAILPSEFNSTYVWKYKIGTTEYLVETLLPELDIRTPLVTTMQNIDFHVALKCKGVIGNYSITTITARAAPPTSINYKKDSVLCKGAYTGSITIESVIGGSGPFGATLIRIDGVNSLVNFSTRAVSSIYNGYKFSNLPEGKYTLFIRNSLNSGQCNIENTIVISEPSTSVNFKTPAFSRSNYSNYNISCNGGSNGTITVHAEGGTGSLQCSLNGGAFQVSNKFENLTARKYKLVVRDANGCSIALPDSITLTQPPVLTARQFISNYNGYGVSCNGFSNGTLDIEASGGTGTYKYSLDNGAFGDKFLFEELSAGPHFVIIKDNNDCTFRLDTILTQPPPIEISDFKVTQPQCFAYDDGSIFIEAQGGVTSVSAGKYKYVLIKNRVRVDSAIAASHTFQKNVSGSYSIEISDDNYNFTKTCVKGTTFFVDQPRMINIILPFNNRVTCKGGTDGKVDASLVGGTAPYYIQWLNANKTVIDEVTTNSSTSINGLSAGFYSIRVKDKNSCSNGVLGGWYEVTFEVKEPETLILNADHQLTRHITCPGESDGSVTLVAEGGWNLSPYKYSKDGISYIENKTLFEKLTPGEHRFFVKDALGCIAEKVVVMEEPAPISIASEELNMVKCNGESDGSIKLAIQGGRPAYSIIVTKGNNSWQDDLFIDGLSKGIYSVTVSDINNCTSVTSFEITEPETLVVSLTKRGNTACGEAKGSLSVNATGGAPFYEFTWYNNQNELIGTSETLEGLAAGRYKVIVTDINNCRAALDLAISNLDGPQGDIVNIQAVKCFGESNGGAEVIIIGGTAPISIVWPNGNTSSSISNLTAGTHLVEIVDANNCKLFLDVVIPTPSPLAINVAENRKPNCYAGCDGNVTVSGVGGTAPYEYLWETGAMTANVSGLCAGIYTVYITDFNGCVYTDSIEVINPDPVRVDLGTSAVICTGQSIRKDAGNPGATYHWVSNNGFVSSERVVDLNKTGIYVVTVTNQNGCTDTDSLDLTVTSSLLKADILMSSEAYEGDTILLVNISWPQPESFQWSFDNRVARHKSDGIFEELIFTTAGEYAIRLDAQLGECKDAAIAYITVKSREEKPLENQRLGYQGSKIQDVKIYPNPSDGNFTTKVILEEDAPISVKLLDAQGASVSKVKALEGNSTYEVYMSIPGLRQGIYILVIQSGNEIKTTRLMVR